MGSNRGLPPRWIRCPPMSDSLISGTFIPLKVPLDHSYRNLLTPETHFTPDGFLNYLEGKKLHVGLWIDLTNTDRYYDRSMIESRGIRFEKINCRGFGECPSEAQVDHFIRIVQEFRHKHENGIVAVHCTHGFNRTGFLICAYLYKSENWDIEGAIKLFAKERSPGIYKQDYIDELLKRYSDDPELVIAAPPKPDWCREEEHYEDDDDEVRPSKRPRMDNGDHGEEEISSDCFLGVDGIVQVVDRDRVMRYQSMCTSLIPFKKGVFPGAQPVSLARSNLQLLAQEKYKVSWKADGSRYLLLILNKDEMVFFDRDYRVFQLSRVQFFERRTQRPMSNTLLDGEFVIDKHNGVNYPRYLIYDIIYCNNQNVSKENFETRLNIIHKEIIHPREEAKKNGMIVRSEESIGIRQKDFHDVKDAYKYFTSKFSSNISHSIDGLIFQPVNLRYTPGRCDKMLKWKPPSLNSVDFKLKIVSETRPGMLEQFIGKLYVLNYEHPFGEIKVTKQLRALNDRIIECSFDLNRKEWIFLRERKDKSHANAYKTALGVMDSIRQPITKDYLLDFIANQRYRE